MISDKNGAYGPESIWATPYTGPHQKGLPAPVSRGSGPYPDQIFNRFTVVLRFPLKSYARAQPNGEHPLQHDVFLEKCGPLLPWLPHSWRCPIRVSLQAAR